VTVQEDLPVGKTLDWVTLETAAEIEVPADAFIDWNPETQTFITVGEKFPDGLTALRKSVVAYPADFYSSVRWHDGSNFSAADFMMSWIMTFDRAYEGSAIYDEAYVSAFQTFQSAFKGFRITSADPFTVEYLLRCVCARRRTERLHQLARIRLWQCPLADDRPR
jgi:peptide/nickel transport system substrate-binding protein